MKQLLFLSLLLGFNHTLFAQKTPQNEVIYHICQRSFYDSNGDLQGDLNGIRQKLDYLQELGVTSILLFPLYEADCYHNYFANDFEQIDPEFGTMKDYIALVKDLHQRGMKIYLDMETQYVTSKHLWWRDAVGNLKSPYSDYILFDDAAHNVPSTIIYDLHEFTGFDGTVIKTTTVNLKSPKVWDYNNNLFSYFLDPNKDGKFEDGVDGFRLDHAMDHLDKKPQLTNLFVDFWKPLIFSLKKKNPNIKIVAEQADWQDVGLEYFEKAKVDRMFGFGVRKAILSFDKQQLIAKADTILGQCPKRKEQIVFIENHDIDRFASLEQNLEKQKLAAALQLFMGGVPSIYYGQELGMKGTSGAFNSTDGNDIPRREAFDWYASGEGKGMAFWYKNGPWWEKQNRKSNDGISLEEQKDDPNSLFNHYKKLIKVRKSSAVLSHGTYQNAGNDNAYIYSFYRKLGKKTLLIAVNLSNSLQMATFTEVHNKHIALYGNAKINQNTATLNPYQIVIWDVE